MRMSRRRRRLLAFVATIAIACGVLTQLDSQVSTAVGAEGVGQGSFPVVEVAGLGSDGSGFAKLTAELQGDGVTVLDFDPDEAGVQPLTYRPPAGQDIPELADETVAPALRAALSRAGMDPDTQVVDVVAHSMGGLVMRYLVEQASDSWASRVDDLVMVATPNHGSSVIGWETSVGGNHFAALGDDMTPGSRFLDSLGTKEPAGEVYTTVGGDPWMFRWYRHGSHGFDDQVPSESPFMSGAANNTRPYLHGRLLRHDDVVDLVAETLRAD
ncbi:MAG: hypothetical protein ABW004_09055 [Aeromicrobium sp.]